MNQYVKFHECLRVNSINSVGFLVLGNNGAKKLKRWGESTLEQFLFHCDYTNK